MEKVVVEGGESAYRYLEFTPFYTLSRQAAQIRARSGRLGIISTFTCGHLRVMAEFYFLIFS